MLIIAAYYISSGLSIRKSESVFTIGEPASMTCSSDLDATSIEWLYNHQIVSYSNNSELELLFNPVNDSIHGEEYTCRVTTSYGIQEQTVQPFVQSMLLYLLVTTCQLQSVNIILLLVPIGDVQVSFMTEGAAIAGEQYGIFCTVAFPLGLTNPTTVHWYGSDGLLSSGSGVTVGETVTFATNATSSLEFNPLRTSHGGQFSCRATITSPAPPYNLIRSVNVDILVEGGSMYISN